MRVLTSREKNFILTGFTVVFCTLLAVYLILPAWGKYMSLKAELANDTRKLTELKQAGKETEILNENMTKLNSEVTKYRKQIPAAPDSAELLFYLNQAAGKTGAVISNFECARPAGTGTPRQDSLTTLSAKVSVIGNYIQIRNFLGQTEKLTRMTHNKVLTVNDVQDQAKLEAIIEFDTFVANYGSVDFKDESDIPKVPTGRPTFFRY